MPIQSHVILIFTMVTTIKGMYNVIDDRVMMMAMFMIMYVGIVIGVGHDGAAGNSDVTAYEGHGSSDHAMMGASPFHSYLAQMPTLLLH